MRNDCMQVRIAGNYSSRNVLIYIGKGLRAALQTYKQCMVAEADKDMMPQIKINVEPASPKHDGLAAQMDRAAADFEHATE